tara:strand:+ start:74 stop:547 length:474 start_codon:yes stop_codon:yes gene_type:complete
MAHDWPQGFSLQFFSPAEFDRPELMDPTFLQDLDRLRMRCGFPLKITDDARNQEDLNRIYAREIAKGLSYPTTSAHLHIDSTLVRSVDIKPAVPRPGDGSDLTLEERELEISYQVLRLWKDGQWPKLGFGIETGHWHIDDTPRLADKRPAFWVAVSR